MTAAGPFEVKLTPQPPGVDAVLARLTLNKEFHGDLEATSNGQMLAFSSSVKGSAGYVAIEHVTGTLRGKQGTFVLQHNGIMTRGEGQLAVTVVPDSGTQDLVGLSGAMRIDIAGGKHSYVFEYTLPGTP
jgi:flagellar basal body rod protein FlgG